MKNIRVLLCAVMLSSVCSMQADWAVRAEAVKHYAGNLAISTLLTAVGGKLFKMARDNQIPEEWFKISTVSWMYDRKIDFEKICALGIFGGIFLGIQTLANIRNYPADKATQKLLQAIRAGDTATVERYIKRGVDINRAGQSLSSDVSIDDCFTPINAAAHHGKADIVRLLIKHNAKIDAYTLLIAAQAGHGDAVKALVEDGKANIYSAMSYAKDPAREYLGQCYLAMHKQQQSTQK